MENSPMPPRSSHDGQSTLHVQQDQPPPGLPSMTQVTDYQDAEHLKILSICYYVMAGLSVLGALVFVIYIFIGGMMMSGSFTSGSHTSAHAVKEMRMMGGMFLMMGVGGTLVVLTSAILEFITAKKLIRRESKLLCMIVAGINCLNMPLGTVLGVFTFIVLSRPSVAESFARNERP